VEYYKHHLEFGSRLRPFRVTWHYPSRDHSIPHRPFSIGGPLEPSLYL